MCQCVLNSKDKTNPTPTNLDVYFYICDRFELMVCVNQTSGVPREDGTGPAVQISWEESLGGRGWHWNNQWH